MSKNANKKLLRPKNKIKANKFLDGQKEALNSNPNTKSNQKSNKGFLIERLKAFITDIFLINMPILYITTYVILDGKQSLLDNQIAIAICTSCYCVIIFFFLWRFGQTPGFRYAEIAIVSINYNNQENLNHDSNTINGSSKKNHFNTERDSNIREKSIKSSNISSLNTKPYSISKPKAWQCLVFIAVWLIEISFFLWVIYFLRKDKRSLHEILSHTKIIYKQNQARKKNNVM
ncbi:RDD family protein [Helicobacter muridarum]|uniref:RDD family protein n=1 Tax=Helicobacter muridarum TaxID=216 RepID=A0A377PUG1_9HELI|nr:RDD family protein [Helicobacter muridarum]STQ86119.1 RDD family protein [Helicobacter muridarum]